MTRSMSFVVSVPKLELGNQRTCVIVTLIHDEPNDRATEAATAKLAITRKEVHPLKFGSDSTLVYCISAVSVSGLPSHGLPRKPRVV